MSSSRFSLQLSFWIVAAVVFGIGQLLRWRLQSAGVLNPGLAFGIQLPTVLVFTVMIIFLIIMIWLFYARTLATWWWSLAMGLIVGGGASNLADRMILKGGALDYWRLGSLSWINFSDIAITFGIILAVWVLNHTIWNQK